MEIFTLAEADVAAIVSSLNNSPPVCLAALDCNWGPPISGRFDTDFLQVWAAADSRLMPKRVSIVGARDNSAWDIQADLSFVSKQGEMQLYYLAVDSPYSFPNQFVIRMETDDGTVYWDNNGGYGVNYRLASYVGRVTSAVVGSRTKTGPGAPHGAIWLLPKFTSYRLVAQSKAE